MSDPRVATPEHECIECGDLLGEGEVCSCQDEENEDDDGWCPNCHGTGEGAFSHRCYHNQMKTFSEMQRDLYRHRGDRD